GRSWARNRVGGRVCLPPLTPPYMRARIRRFARSFETCPMRGERGSDLDRSNTGLVKPVSARENPRFASTRGWSCPIDTPNLAVSQGVAVLLLAFVVSSIASIGFAAFGV